MASITPYALARRLSEIAQLLTNQFVKVLMPLASELHAGNDHEQLRHLYIASSRLTLAAFVPIGLVISIFADTILTVWVGPQYALAAPLVLVLTMANLIDMSQWPAAQLLQGMGKHHPISLISIISAFINLGLSIILLQHLGVIGVALGTLIPSALETGLFVLPYALHTIKVSISTWLRRIFLPAALPALPTTLLLYYLHRTSSFHSLLDLCLISIMACVVYTLLFLLSSSSERVLLLQLLHLVRRDDKHLL